MANDTELSGRELLQKKRRESQDVFRVHNPTREDYVVEWGKADINTPWKIPKAQRDIGYGRGNRDVPRYIAHKFIKEMTNILLQREADDRWQEFLDERNPQPSEYVAKEEERLNSRVFKDKELRQEMREKILVGLVKKHGDDIREPEPYQADKREDSVDSFLEDAPSVDEIEDAKKDLAEQVSGEASSA